ncbi:GNAT family N-acetyltransferase [Pseudolysinimonas sp.]|uniref:GNAT family N-acetyltransferase n=1 Tax=Pseudolysinimonas sp. TaxID=2680009 RepID=UPI003F81596C
MTDDSRRANLLAVYDDHLRTEAETAGALTLERLGPLHLATFVGGRGFVTYRDLDGADAGALRRLAPAALDRFRTRPEVARVEWKTRGHDAAPGLHDALVANGFEPDEPESIMMGELSGLVDDVALPPGVTLRTITADDDIRALGRMQEEAFGLPATGETAEAMIHGLALDAGIELWVAEADGRIVSAGRLEPVAGSDIVGLWGGATLPAWRGRGIYRALTAARARSALASGHRFAHSDSTEASRPILERAGLVRVSTTTPYEWVR